MNHWSKVSALLNTSGKRKFSRAHSSCRLFWRLGGGEKETGKVVASCEDVQRLSLCPVMKCLLRCTWGTEHGGRGGGGLFRCLPWDHWPRSVSRTQNMYFYNFREIDDTGRKYTRFHRRDLKSLSTARNNNGNSREVNSSNRIG